VLNRTHHTAPRQTDITHELLYRICPI